MGPVGRVGNRDCRDTGGERVRAEGPGAVRCGTSRVTVLPRLGVGESVGERRLRPPLGVRPVTDTAQPRPDPEWRVRETPGDEHYRGPLG